MSYTLWHCGILIGETDFEEPGRQPPQLAGIFRPTEYGRGVFPRLTGILTAGSGLKDELEARGLNEDDMTAEEVEAILETTAAGQKVIDIGRALSEVELRDPDGQLLEFKQIAFIDLGEIAALSRKLGCNEDMELEALPDAPQHRVSVTLGRREEEDDEFPSPPGVPLPRLGPRQS